MVEDGKLKTDMTAQKNKAVIEQLWLTYFNDTLYAKGADHGGTAQCHAPDHPKPHCGQNAMSCPGGDCNAQSPSAFAALEKVVEP